MGTRRRLDNELVRRAMVASREQAKSLIADGRVTVAGALADKPARMVSPDEAVVVLGEPDRFVGRGATKLEAALDTFEIDPHGARALDAGASTGGFTDSLLQRGASGVVALDVGHGQLHERLRRDERVTVLERTNIRGANEEMIGGRVDLTVADLSFISLRTVAPVLCSLTLGGGPVVTLVKPQFEAGREEASKGRGVIRDPEIWRRVLDEVCVAFRSAGAAIMGVMTSPITGAEGNVEFLLLARAPVDSSGAASRCPVDGAALDDAGLAEALDDVVARNAVGPS